MAEPNTSNRRLNSRAHGLSWVSLGVSMGMPATFCMSTMLRLIWNRSGTMRGRTLLRALWLVMARIWRRCCQGRVMITSSTCWLRNSAGRLAVLPSAWKRPMLVDPRSGSSSTKPTTSKPNSGCAIRLRMTVRPTSSEPTINTRSTPMPRARRVRKVARRTSRAMIRKTMISAVA
jgi:hypothetical protein